MSRRAIKKYRLIKTGNRGQWLSAKIYSDMRSGCQCGGKFTAVGELEGMEYPVCDSCKKPPTLFRIRAKILTENLEVKYIDIRHDRTGKRLSKTHHCLNVLERVNEELEKGAFNYRDYDSEDSRASYLFENYVVSYLNFHEKRLKRKELSPSGFANKKTSVNNLIEFFKGRDISSIRRPDIENYKNSFTDRFRARDLAISELKSILKHAMDIDEVITKIPKFDLMPASKKRKEIISLETALKVIDEIEDEQYQVMLKLLTVYPVRPGELRALQWRDIDYFAGKVSFKRHFSADVLMEGRKSIDSGDKSEVSFPITKDFMDYLHSIPRPLKSDAFVFSGKENDFVSGNCLSRAWRKATDKLKLPPYQLYEMRHARLSQIAEQSNGDMVKLLRVSGHTNPKTLMDRYVRDTSDLTEYFQ